MKKILMLFLVLPMMAVAQNANDILDRITMIRSLVENPNGQIMFKQTKNWCTDFLQLDDAQSESADQLYETQYADLSLAYKNYDIKYNSTSFHALIDLIVKQEKFFRILLTPQQLTLYLAHFSVTTANPANQKNKAFNTLFMSDAVLENYKEN